MTARRVTAVDVERLIQNKETVWGQIRTAMMRNETKQSDLQLLRDCHAKLSEKLTDAISTLATQPREIDYTEAARALHKAAEKAAAEMDDYYVHGDLTLSGDDFNSYGDLIDAVNLYDEVEP